MKLIDLTGKVFGRLTVLKRYRKITPVTWICRCKCGKIKKIRALNLGRSTFSCGCQRNDNIRLSNTTHGFSYTPELHAYTGAMGRCRNPRNNSWECYGGRGIEFKFRSFMEFINHVGMKPEPKRLYSLDRINNEGHYEPGNVRWATRSEQMRNRRMTYRMLRAMRINMSKASACRGKSV